MRHTLTLFSFFLLFFTSCREDIELLTTDTTTPPPTVTMGDGNIQVRGRVITEGGIPLSDALIASRGGNTRSDDSGNYTLPTVETLPDGAAFIYISREGYFEEYRQIYPGAASINVIDIVLHSTREEARINGVTGGNFEDTSGVRLTIPPGAAQSLGQPYTGNIHVSLVYKDPTLFTDMAQSAANVPGWQDNELVELATYGMAQVRMETESGLPVYFPQNKPARLEMPLPDVFARTVDTMRFWQLQEEVWFFLEGADLSNGFMAANIFGGGYYNCDIPYPRAHICGTLVDTDDMLLRDHPFALVLANGAFVFSTRTDDRGRFCVRVARDQLLRLRIPDPCAPDEILFEVTLGPFPEGPTEIGPVPIEVVTSRKLINLTDCADGSLVGQDKGLLWVSGFGGGYPVRANNAGLASLLLPDCGTSSTFEVQAVANDFRRTSPIEIVGSDDLSNLNLEICSELETNEFFSVDIPDLGAFPMFEGSYLLRQNNDGSQSHQLWAQRIVDSDTTEFFLNLPELATGDYSEVPQAFHYAPGSRTVYLCDGCAIANTTITAIGPNQGFISGNFNFWADHRDLETGTTLDTRVMITGSFQINR